MMRHLPLTLLVLVVLWVPLPFGSVTPLGVLIAVLLIVALVLAELAAGRVSLEPGVSGVLAGLGGLGLLGMFQSSSWAARGFGFLSDGLAARLPASLATAQPSLSLAPGLSRQAALGWWALALLFLAATCIGRQRTAKPWLIGAAMAGATLQALYGWRQWVVAPREILGRQVPGPARLRGTMVNADHLAVLFEIAMAVCLAWGWWAWRRSRREPRLAYRLAWLLPPLLGWAGCAAALVGTGSRAALAAVALGLVFQSALFFDGRWRWWVSAGLLLSLALAVSLLVSRGPSPELGRQLSRPAYEVVNSSRFAVWKPALRLWRESPWIGTGLGTFEEGFPRVQPAELMGERWGRAHNDPLELLVTGGLVGVGLFGFALVCLVRRLWRIYRGAGRTAARGAALAALAALPVIALHEGVDFGLTVPANAIWLTVLLGVGAAGPMGRTGRTGREEEVAPLRSL